MLGLTGKDDEASEHDIRRAFKLQSLHTHPDRGGSSEAHAHLVRALDTALTHAQQRATLDVESPLMKARKDAARRIRQQQQQQHHNHHEYGHEHEAQGRPENDADAILRMVQQQRNRSNSSTGFTPAQEVGQQRSTHASQSAVSQMQTATRRRRGILLFVTAVGALTLGAHQQYKRSMMLLQQQHSR